MRKKAIAVFVLAALGCWNVPLALAVSARAHRTVPQASKAQDHSCCPGFHVQLAAPLFVVMPRSEMPCGDQHPCCAKQRPESFPALTTGTKVERPKAEGAETTISENDRQMTRAALRQESGCKLLSSYFDRSTVLRI